MWRIALGVIDANQRHTIDPKELCTWGASVAQDTLFEGPRSHETSSAYQVPSSTPHAITPPASPVPASVDNTKSRYHTLLGQTLSSTEWKQVLYLERKASVSSESSTDPDLHSGRRSDKSLKCPWHDCTYPGTFRGHYERNRHMAAKHNTHHGLKCPIPGCSKSQNRTFRRADKLSSHLRHTHHPSTIYSCVQGGCSARLPGKLMFAHLQRHLVSSQYKASPTAAALLNALSPAFPQCPVPNCAAHTALNRLPAHLLEYHSMEIAFIHQELSKINYPCTLADNDHNETIYGNGASFATLVHISCPICKCRCMDHQSFQKHLVDTHILKELDHFQKWSSAVEGMISSTYEWIGTPPTGDATWTPWRLTLLGADHIDLEIHCPECKEIEAIEAGGPITHHLGMLVQPEHLSPYREEILDLYPEFATHPVFDDIHGCQSAIVQAFRLKRIGPRRASNGKQDPISNDDIGPPPSHSIEAPPNAASLDDPRLMDLDWSHMIPTRWDSSCASSNSDFPYEGSESDQISNILPCTLNPIISDERSTQQHGSDCNSLYVSDSPQTARSISRQYSSRSKPYTCGHCDMAFERQSELNHHKRNHLSNEEKPHRCSWCSKGFLDLRDWRRHLQTHSLIEPEHICHVIGCRKAFKRGDNLTRHIRRFHSQLSIAEQ